MVALTGGFAQSLVVEVPAGLDPVRLEAAVRAVVDGHDVLRARLEVVDGVPEGLVVPEKGTVTVPVHRVDATGAVDPDDLSALVRGAERAAVDGLDPVAGRMVHTAWLDRGPDTPGRLLIVVHHLAVDGVSWRVLLPDLAAAHDRAADPSRAPEPDPAGTPFRQWALALAAEATAPARIAELPVWERLLAGPGAPIGSRPLDPAVDTVAAGIHQTEVRIPVPVTADLLTRVPAAFHAGIEDVLLAALVAALQERRGDGAAAGPVLVDVEGHGREPLTDVMDLTRTVGWFTSSHPLRLDATGIDVTDARAGGPEAGRLLKRVKEQIRDVPGDGLGYGLLRYANPETAPALAALPTAQIGFNYLGRFHTNSRPEGGNWQADADRVLGGAADPRMALLHALEAGGLVRDLAGGPEMVLTLGGPAGLFDPAELDRIATDWAAVLAGLARHAADPGAGGHSPSDFPLVDLAPPEVEELETAVPHLVDVWPLSPLQEGMLFHARYDEGAPDVYVGQRTLDLEGPLRPDVLRASWQALVDRHANLRTGVRQPGGTGAPVQVVAATARPPWREVDLSALPPAEAAAEALRLTAEEHTRFDLTTPPLLRFLLLRTGPDRHRLVITMHHIVLDGWSLPLLFGELSEVYAADGDPSALPPVAPYRDYLAWLHGQDRDASARAWRRALAGTTEPTLVTRLDRDAEPLRSRHVTALLDAEVTHTLRETARAHGLTLNTVVQGAWAVLVALLTGRDDVVFGTTVAGRPAEIPGVERMLGLFINTVPVRVRLDPARSTLDLLTTLQAEQAELIAHQYTGLTDIQRAAGPGATFDTLVVYENYPHDPGAGRELGGLRITGGSGDEASHYPLTLIVSPAERLELRLDYRPDLFDEEDARTLVERTLRILTDMAAAPAAPTSRIDHLTGAARERVLTRWNDTAHPLPDTATLPELFARRARSTPDAPAVDDAGTLTTYARLDALADRLARRLLALGLSPEQRVAVLHHRSTAFVVSLLAVLKAGGTYVPLDPDAPADRTRRVLAAADATLLLTDSALVTHPATRHADTLVLTDTDTDTDHTTDPAPPVPTRHHGHPDRLAYVMFTSGSTGTPKGVAVTHRAVTALALDPCWTGTGSHGRVLVHSPQHFDASTYELWVPLLGGGTLVLAPRDTDARTLQRIVPDRNVTALWLTAGLFRLLAEESPHCLRGVREVWTGGEAVPATAVCRVLEACPGTTVVDGYGPTETTTFATAHPLTAPQDVPDSVPIGRPMANTRTYVLDSALRPVPEQVPGELYVAGAGLARGYLGQVARTAERFVPDPFATSPGARMYRTGDIVRWRPDGTLDYLGRSDDQVKVRGFRVEPGEVEAVLARHPAVAQVGVLAREDTSGVTRLVAYAVARPGTDLTGLRDFAAERLPDPMVPLVVALDALPLTANGKLDRTALPAPEFTTRAGRPPATPAEEALCALYAEVLDLERVSAEDSFFDLGGDSLLAMRLVVRVRAALDAEISVRDLFSAPTVAALARRVTADGTDPARPRPTPRERPEVLPLSFGQQRMWFLNQLQESGVQSADNVPLALRFSGVLDADALSAALHDVADRHETLRTVFPATAGSARPRLLGSAPPLRVHRVTRALLPDAMADTATRGFDLARDQPWRTELLIVTDPDPTTWPDPSPDPADPPPPQGEPGEYVLMLVAHHIAVDGWSMGILARDLRTAYTARRRGTAPDWAPLPVQYADYASWQREVLGDPDDPDSLISAQLDHWRTALDGLPEELALPTDRTRPAIPSFTGGSVPLDLTPDTHARLLDLARHGSATLFMVVQAALAVLLTRLGAGTDIPVGTAVAGRGDPVLEDLAGFFVNTLVLRTDTTGNPSFEELLARVRESDLAAYAHQDVPFERLVDDIGIERTLARHPLFQVMLVLQNVPGADWDLPGLTMHRHASEVLPDSALPSRFDLSINLTEHHDEHGRPDGLRGGLQYSADLFDGTTARTLADRLARVLDQVAVDPRRHLADLDVMDADEEWKVVQAWNDTGCVVSAGSVVELFEGWVGRSPGAVAVVGEDVSWTYEELGRLSDRVAGWLVGCGVGVGGRVGVVVGRSPWLVAVLLGVWKAGAAFVPLDAGHPVERLRSVADGAGLDVVVADRVVEGLETVSLEDLFAADPLTTPAVVSGESLAYVMFTSGSTGEPKGVAVTHRSVAAFVSDRAWRQDVVARVLVQANHAFDASTYELWVPLARGGTLVVVPAGEVDAAVRGRLIAEHGVTNVHVTAGLFRVLAEESPEVFAGVREVSTGGDVVSSSAIRALLTRYPELTVRTTYGPTETTAFTTQLPYRAGDEVPGSVPLGRPMDNSRAYVLDEFLRPVPPGVVGELYVAGDGLARGYDRRPGLTAERFVACPYDEGRMYRTGDLARWSSDGVLEFAGRVDEQVKIRGFRIEPGEVEAVLAERPEVGQAAVVVREDQPGAKRLVAYVVPAEPGQLDTAALRDHLAGRLPDYLVPAAFTALDALPVTVNGKLDRAALPVPEAPTSAGRGPETPTEELLCALFAEVLGLERVGAEDSFFALGGDSIMSMLVVARARRAGVVITARQVFERKSPAALAAVARAVDDRETGTGAEEADSGTGRAPLTPVMLDLVERAGPAALTGVLSQSMLVETPAGLERSVLEAALQAVLDHHDVLRARLVVTDDTAHLEVPEPVPVGDRLRRVDTTGLDEERAAEVVQAEGRRAVDRLDPRAGEMIRAVWFDAGPDRPGRLLLVAHHLVIDGVSWRVLVPDLAAAATALKGGDSPELARTTSYRHWAKKLENDALSSARVGELASWKRLLRGPNPLLGRRALDPAVDTVAAGVRQVEARVQARITSELLTRVPAAFGIGVDDVLLAALVAAVGEWRRRRGRNLVGGLLVDVEGHGREPLTDTMDLTRTVGWFTSSHPVRIDPGTSEYAAIRSGGPAAGLLLRRTREQLRAVPGDGIGHGLLRHLNPRTSEALAGLPSPQIGFNYLGRFAAGGSAAAGDATWQPVGDSVLGGTADADTPAAHLLEAGGIVRDRPEGPELTVSLVCPVGPLDEAALQALIDGWAAMLAGIAAHRPEEDHERPTSDRAPSNSPLVALAQSQIDALQSKLTGEKE
ncbi:amino acid adenylation domain-containing protein [Streptomyces sp. NPDC049906]|uniref:amino acid adenylation domain-containing protein n=1 Tax=Streptomyces sp. NPDC049906 TaxID=3155656 RepID=UPI00342F4B38